MQKLFTSLAALAFAFAVLLPVAVQAQAPYTNGVFYEFNSNGDLVPVKVPFNGTNNVSQDFIVTSNGTIAVNTITKGNVTQSIIASGSAVSLTTATAKNVTSLTLGVGTWRLYGYIDYVLASATSTVIQSGFGTTTNSFTLAGQAQDNALIAGQAFTTTSITLTQATPWVQVTVASGTTTFYMVGEATFSAGTVTAYGTMNAVQVK